MSLVLALSMMLLFSIGTVFAQVPKVTQDCSHQALSKYVSCFPDGSMVPVGILFYGQPSAEDIKSGKQIDYTGDIELIKSYGGNVTQTYQIIHGAAANIPKDKVLALANDPRIQSIEPDSIGGTGEDPYSPNGFNITYPNGTVIHYPYGTKINMNDGSVIYLPKFSNNSTSFSNSSYPSTDENKTKNIDNPYFDGTITTSACHIIEGEIIKQTLDSQTIDVCHHYQYNFKIQELPPDTTCIAVMVYWKEHDTGKVYAFGDPCNAPHFYDLSKNNLTYTEPTPTMNNTTSVNDTEPIPVMNNNTTSVNNANLSIISVQPTDQQGIPVLTFAKGENGFVKVVLSSQLNQTALTTIDLISSDLTSLGTGSIRNILDQTTSEITLSFYIPDTTNGTTNICVDVYSNWLDKGGIPLVKESCVQIQIENSTLKYNNADFNTNPSTINRTSIISNQISDNNTIISNKTQLDCSGSSDAFKRLNMSELAVTPKVISSSGYLKILCVGMSPNTLKVGDNVTFGLDFKNISDNPLLFHGQSGLRSFNLLYTISPQNSVQEFPSCIRPYCSMGADWDWPMSPNMQIAFQGLSSNEWGGYKILKPGMLTVTMNLKYVIPKGDDLTDLQNVTALDYKVRVFTHLEKYGSTQVSDIIQFNVNATQ